MKLASLRQGGRDGTLVVVSRDLARCTRVAGIATLQAALDDWSTHAPQLASVARLLEQGQGASQPFDPAACAAPLPRAYQWADGSAYLNHVELVRKARGAEVPKSFYTDPLMYQGGSDVMLGACEDVPFLDEAHGIDCEGEVAAIVDDVPMNAAADAALARVRLLMLVNDWSLRNLIPAELAKGFGFFHAKPATSCSPVAVTPDELGDAWRGGNLHLRLRVSVNGVLLGEPDAGADVTFGFGDLIAHAARTRRLTAGTIVGSGTVSNRDRAAGSACISELRTLETIEHGAPRSAFLRFGDRVRIEMLDGAGASVFGALDQRVVQARTTT